MCFDTFDIFTAPGQATHMQEAAKPCGQPPYSDFDEPCLWEFFVLHVAAHGLAGPRLWEMSGGEGNLGVGVAKPGLEEHVLEDMKCMCLHST